VRPGTEFACMMRVRGHSLSFSLAR
jgi:hypothetical protein